MTTERMRVLGVPRVGTTRLSEPRLYGPPPGELAFAGPARMGATDDAPAYTGPGVMDVKAAAARARGEAQLPFGVPVPEPGLPPEAPVAPPPLIEAADMPPRFDGEVDDVLVCRRVIVETHDVKTFVFSARAPRLFRFKPGQFLTFSFPVPGGPVERCYTIASSPTRPDRVAITVKRVPGGIVSNWLHDAMQPGMEVSALGPMGEFTAADHPAEKYLFLSGGSGITPLMSMSRALYDLADDADVTFVHAARSPRDVVFADELAAMAARAPAFRVAHVVESTEGAGGWAGFRGRLSIEMLGLIAPDFRDREVFTCGPAPFMAAVRRMLEAAGHPPERYHEESFSFAELTPLAAAAAAIASDALAEAAREEGAEEGFRIELTRSGRTLLCPPDRTVLEAARLAGVRLPSACSRGMCGTCKSKIVSGTVEMTHAGGIRQREIDAGMALLCCSKPLTDLVVER